MTARRFILLYGALAALLASAAPASAASTAAATPAPHPPSAHASSDLRCLAVSMAMDGSKDPTIKNLGMQGTTYYLGRLDGHGMRQNLENALVGQFMSMKPADLMAEAKLCTQSMAARAAIFRAISSRVQDRLAKTSRGARAAQATVQPAAPATPATPFAPTPH